MATTVSHAHRRGRADIFSPGFIPTVTIASFRRITAPVRLTPSLFYHWVRCWKGVWHREAGLLNYWKH